MPRRVQACPNVIAELTNRGNGFLCLSKSVQVWKNAGKTCEAISSQVPLTTQPPFHYVDLIG